MRRWLGVVMMAAVLVTAMACSAPDQADVPQPEWVTPVVDLRGTQNGRLEIRLGVANETQRNFTEDEAFDGRWQLIDAGGDVRAEGHLYHLGPLDPEETDFPMSWTGVVETTDYRLLWGAPSIGSVIAEFQVELSNGTVTVRQLSQQPADVYPPEGGYID